MTTSSTGDLRRGVAEWYGRWIKFVLAVIVGVLGLAIFDILPGFVVSFVFVTSSAILLILTYSLVSGSGTLHSIFSKST